eukprot:20454-Heterococcus_DN1.PRE.3
MLHTARAANGSEWQHTMQNSMLRKLFNKPVVAAAVLLSSITTHVLQSARSLQQSSSSCAAPVRRLLKAFCMNCQTTLLQLPAAQVMAPAVRQGSGLLDGPSQLRVALLFNERSPHMTASSSCNAKHLGPLAAATSAVCLIIAVGSATILDCRLKVPQASLTTRTRRASA